MDQLLTVQSFVGAIHPMFESTGILAFCYKEKARSLIRDRAFGDPDENRTRITAVKGRCLNRLTTGPGSGCRIRTNDTPGMNRVL